MKNLLFMKYAIKNQDKEDENSYRKARADEENYLGSC